MQRSIDRRGFLCSAAFSALAGAYGSRARARALRAKRVVVIGGGFGGSACALYLRRLAPGIAVTLVDPETHYVTCPLSNDVIAGMRELGGLTTTRDGLRRSGVTVVPDRVEAIDAPARRLRLATGADVGFDRLVLAPGIRFLTHRIDGYDDATAERMPHAWQAGEQTLRLATQLRAMRDGGVVAISVPQGLIRCPPAPYERASLIAEYLKRRKPRSKILIFDANNHFPKQDLFVAAWEELYPGMVEWIAPSAGGAIDKVDSRTMTLWAGGAAHRVDVANVIPPQAPAPLAADAGLAAEHGWCPVDPRTFQSQLQDAIHVIGDACIADDMPKSGSAAVSQARQCARALVALLGDREPPPPRFDSVCYSLVAGNRGIRIARRYRLLRGRISVVEPAATADEDPAAVPAAAALWYRRIRIQAFGG